MRRVVIESVVEISYSLKWIDSHPSSKGFPSRLGCFIRDSFAEAPGIKKANKPDIFMCSMKEDVRSPRPQLVNYPFFHQPPLSFPPLPLIHHPATMLQHT